jgi:DNA-binding MarR family transcriptional regulator
MPTSRLPSTPDQPGAGGEPARLDDYLALRRAMRTALRIHEEAFAGQGLGSTQFCVLTCIDRANAVRMKDLVTGLGLERTSLLRALQPLERRGLIVTEPRGQGMRNSAIRLTEDGQKALRDALPAWRRGQDAFERRFGAGIACLAPAPPGRR